MTTVINHVEGCHLIQDAAKSVWLQLYTAEDNQTADDLGITSAPSLILFADGDQLFDLERALTKALHLVQASRRKDPTTA